MTEIEWYLRQRDRVSSVLKAAGVEDDFSWNFEYPNAYVLTKGGSIWVRFQPATRKIEAIGSIHDGRWLIAAPVKEPELEDAAQIVVNLIYDPVELLSCV